MLARWVRSDCKKNADYYFGPMRCLHGVAAAAAVAMCTDVITWCRLALSAVNSDGTDRRRVVVIFSSLVQ